MPSPDPKWSLLHSHYNFYREVDIENDRYGINASYVKRDTDTDYFKKQQLLPVVSNAQFIFSMSAEDRRGDSGMAPNDGFLGLGECRHHSLESI